MKASPNHNLSKVMVRYLSLGSALLCCCMLSHPVFAVEPVHPAADSQTAKRFGVVWRISGEVVADAEANGKAHPLREGSPVYVGEHIRASSSGEAVIKTDDAGIVAVRPGTEFIPERFAADGKKTDNMTLRLVTGSLRVITGWIGKLNRAEHRVVTPTATIGIRGTDHEPYVLPADLAEKTQYQPGTYDKVNRGKTSLGEGDQSLEIESGRVGFARQPAFAAKGLMTILMPVLLDKVPGFYVPGKFDAELDQYTQTADAESAQQLAQKRKAGVACAPDTIARDWLRNFDRAVVKRDSPAILALFAPDVKVKATVLSTDGKMSTVEFNRDELVQSTVAAMKGIKHYRQRRLTLEAEQSATGAGASCDHISLRSSVIEQGVQSGKPYRLESTEEYLLELREGKWLAVKAETTQR